MPLSLPSFLADEFTAAVNEGELTNRDRFNLSGKPAFDYLGMFSEAEDVDMGYRHAH